MLLPVSYLAGQITLQAYLLSEPRQSVGSFFFSSTGQLCVSRVLFGHRHSAVKTFVLCVAISQVPRSWTVFNASISDIASLDISSSLLFLSTTISTYTMIPIKVLLKGSVANLNFGLKALSLLWFIIDKPLKNTVH